MESIDAVARLEIAGGNIDGAIGDDRLGAEDGTEWFTTGIGERAEEIARYFFPVRRAHRISSGAWQKLPLVC